MKLSWNSFYGGMLLLFSNSFCGNFEDLTVVIYKAVVKNGSKLGTTKLLSWRQRTVIEYTNASGGMRLPLPHPSNVCLDHCSKGCLGTIAIPLMRPKKEGNVGGVAWTIRNSRRSFALESVQHYVNNSKQWNCHGTAFTEGCCCYFSIAFVAILRIWQLWFIKLW